MRVHACSSRSLSPLPSLTLFPLTILIILMPLKPLIRVNHKQIRAQPNLLTHPTLRQHMPQRTVVVEVAEEVVRLPHVALDVVLQLGGGAGEGPEVG